MADNFIFYKSWLDVIQKYRTVEEQKEIIYAIVQYGILGERNPIIIPEFMEQTFAQIDSAKDKHDKRVSAGKKGGQSGKGSLKARVGNKNASKTQANASKTQANENENVNENENENNILIENDSSSTISLNRDSLDEINKKENKEKINPFGKTERKSLQELNDETDWSEYGL